MVGSAEDRMMKLCDEQEQEQADLAGTSMTSATQPLRKGDSKFCLVCGDKALGYNFNAITCESCKAFFRRNALKTKEFRCPFEGNCKVDAVTRRFCQRCRLRKCFDVGMKKEWIMSDEEKVKKKQKIEANRVRRMQDSGMIPSDGYIETSAGGNGNNSQDAPVVNNNLNNHNNNATQVLSQPTPCKVFRSSDSGQGQGHPFVAPSPSDLVEVVTRMPPPATNQMAAQLGPRADGWTNGVGVGIGDDVGIRVGEKRRFASASAVNLQTQGFFDDPSQMGVPCGDQNGSLMTALLSPAPEQGTCGGAVPAGSFSQSSVDPVFPLGSVGQINGIGDDEEVKLGYQEQTNECTLHAGLADQRRCRPIIDPLETVNGVLSVAIRAEFSAASLIGFNFNQTELNDVERAKIYELVAANEAMLSPIDVDASHKHCFKDPSLISVINLTDLAIRRIIKMMKRVSGFKNLCQEDQIALLKGGCTELMILRSVMTYDPEVNSWKIPHTSTPSIVKLEVLKKAGGNVYEEHQRFIRSFTPLWRNDENIMLILGAITLFSPERPNVIHKDVVKLEQDSYYYLLKRYLESILPGCEAKSQYLKLIHRVQELHYLNENHVRVYLDINPKEVEPLLIEIFDLMRHHS